MYFFIKLYPCFPFFICYSISIFMALWALVICMHINIPIYLCTNIPIYIIYPTFSLFFPMQSFFPVFHILNPYFRQPLVCISLPLNLLFSKLLDKIILELASFDGFSVGNMTPLYCCAQSPFLPFSSSYFAVFQTYFAFIYI